LADHARSAGAKRVDIIPTVIELTRYPRPPATTVRGVVMVKNSWQWRLSYVGALAFLIGIIKTYVRDYRAIQRQ
jgi:hypothetical protein